MSQFTAGSVRVCWCVLLVLGYLLYLLLGATIFQVLEKQAESQTRDRFQLEKLNFLKNYTCLDGPALEKFVEVILDAWEKGVNPSGNSTNPSYGNLSPSTVSGQVFCVFYALFGIPLNLAFLNQLGKGLTAHLGQLERSVLTPGQHGQTLKMLTMYFFLILGTLLFLVFPPVVFSYVEGWTYGEGFYYAFITLSTIGFGDYVVGMDWGGGGQRLDCVLEGRDTRYGDMTPTTTHGQLFCVLFALVGIPLNVVVLNKFGKFMLSIEQRISDYIGRKINCRKTARVLITGISFLIGMTLFIFIPSYSFHTFENWTYNEGFYFTIITLSTIGFGDYVAGNNPDINYPVCYREVVAAWIFFGLAWLSLVINSCIEMLEKISEYFNQRQLNTLENKTIEETAEPGEEISEIKEEPTASECS
ncbi:UNVERIFIED_CONTAM: hypothetical protein FKN15_014979 [Acipenser sinensis]